MLICNIYEGPCSIMNIYEAACCIMNIYEAHILPMLATLTMLNMLTRNDLISAATCTQITEV